MKLLEVENLIQEWNFNYMKVFVDCGHDHVLMKRMIPYWNKCGVSVSPLPNGCDVHLSFTHFITHTNLPKVLRLDGVYYDCATDYTSRNSNLDASTKIANGIIYQSAFAKKWCYRYLSDNETAKTDIIYNGINPMWCGLHIDNDIFDILLISNWRRWKRLREMTEVFLEFKRTTSDKVHLHIIGNHDYKVDDRCITYYGELSHEDSKHLFQIADASMHIAKRDWCPNSLIETLGAGVPVLTTDAEGGAKEIIRIVDESFICSGDNNENEKLYQYTDEYNKLSINAKNNLINSLNNCKMNKYRSCHKLQFNIEYVAWRYLRMLESVCQK